MYNAKHSTDLQFNEMKHWSSVDPETKSRLATNKIKLFNICYSTRICYWRLWGKLENYFEIPGFF